MLPEETLEIISKIGPLDILIGIPSFNNEDTIGHVAKAIKLGLIKYFPDHRSGLVHLDAHSTDQTVARMKQELKTAPQSFNSILIINQHHPSVKGTAILPEEIAVAMPKRGKGNVLRGFFEIARAVGAKACAVFDSDLRSITPEWVPMMIGPVLLKDYDYVMPQYCRHKYDGTITNSIVYPLTTTLYGQNLRQPIGGEFGFSSRLIDAYLEKKFKTMEVGQFGIDVWMTTIALANKMKICQSFLGAKIHDHKDPSVSLAPMFKQVVGTIFQLMSDFEEEWTEVKSIAPISTFGFGCTVIPEEIKINQEALVNKFQQGFEQYGDLWSEILPPKTVREVESLLKQQPGKLMFPQDLWAKIIYDFAAFYNSGCKKIVKNKSVLALVPLYFGYIASFANLAADASFAQAEQNVDNLVKRFLKLKPYLISQWNKSTRDSSLTKTKKQEAKLPASSGL